MGEKLDVAVEMRRSADAMAEHAASLRAEGDDDQAEAVAVIAAGNLEIAKAVEAKDRRIATLEAKCDTFRRQRDAEIERVKALDDERERLEAERDEARRERDEAVAQRERYRAILCNLVMDLDDLGRNGWHGIRKLTEAMARSATADEGGAVIEDAETCESCGRAVDVSEIDWRYEDAYICKLCSARLAREEGGAGA